MPDRVVTEEINLLAKVASLLSELPEAKTASEAPIVRELERLREVILSGDEAKDISALTEQYHHQASVLNQLRSAGTSEGVDAASPYFAHLRLKEDGKTRDLCLGRTTCIERGIRIVDWRDAPISKIFYSYRQGEQYDEEIAGRERIGEVMARRMVRIRNGVLERVQSPEGDYSMDEKEFERWHRTEPHTARLQGGEGAALRAFGEGEGAGRRLGTLEGGLEMRADKRLPEITGLIDPLQFELITESRPGFLVIRGAAGSGKTTVALHRVAYLAFDDPRIDGPETLVVVFSPALRNFVSHVLPSLGLSNVRIVSYREWVSEERRRHFQNVSASVRNDTSALAQRMKLHPFLSLSLERYIEMHEGAPTAERVLDDWAGVLCEEELLVATAKEVEPDWDCEAEIRKFVHEQRIQLESFFAGLGGDESALVELDPEDDALLLRAWQLRVGALRAGAKKPLRLRHLVIDEVQDFSALEVQVLLGCMDDRASITLAGDTHQHVMKNSGFSSWTDFFHLIGIPGTEVDTLRVSYRSARPIVEFAQDLLGDLAESDEAPEATRDGPPVEFFRFADRGACVAFVADALRQLARDEPAASVALLTPSVAVSAAYHETLERCELPRLRWVRDEKFSFAAGVEIAEIDQVKGLEFDYVILLDVDSVHFPDLPETRRLLHVGATRAIHQLWLMSVGTPAPMLGGLDES